jgi:cytochrome P450
VTFGSPNGDGRFAHFDQTALVMTTSIAAVDRFGGGPCGCIGNQFAMLEAQLIAAAIAQR